MKILIDNEFKKVKVLPGFELWTNKKCFVCIQYEKDLFSVALSNNNCWSNTSIKRFCIPFTESENKEILDYVLSL